ncbi:hypothetical protein LZ30DRAFT_683775 [Colletotrichum cereale]|nr:hypothetical protein LZ30DRAFT_683775 [Colletotrichum cereale]
MACVRVTWTRGKKDYTHNAGNQLGKGEGAVWKALHKDSKQLGWVSKDTLPSLWDTAEPRLGTSSVARGIPGVACFAISRYQASSTHGELWACDLSPAPTVHGISVNQRWQLLKRRGRASKKSSAVSGCRKPPAAAVAARPWDLGRHCQPHSEFDRKVPRACHLGCSRRRTNAADSGVLSPTILCLLLPQAGFLSADRRSVSRGGMHSSDQDSTSGGRSKASTQQHPESRQLWPPMIHLGPKVILIRPYVNQGAFAARLDTENVKQQRKEGCYRQGVFASILRFLGGVIIQEAITR